MAEEPQKKPRKKRSDAGIPKKRPLAEVPQTAPIEVRFRLKGSKPDEWISLGCSDRTVENGFHVFLFPSLTDRYRTTRREVAISEIAEIEFTEAAPRQVFDVRPPLGLRSAEVPASAQLDTPAQATGPRIHNARDFASNSLLQRLETAREPVKLDAMPGSNLSFQSGSA